MPYTSGEFEKLVRDSGLRPIARRHLKDGMYLYSAEGVKQANEHVSYTHYKFLWAVGVDNNLMFAQPIIFPTHITLPNTMITVPSSREDRIQAAEKQALDVIKTAESTEYFNVR